MKRYLLALFCTLLFFSKAHSQISYTAPDGTYTLAMGANDDGSSGQISLPFSFCLYGNTYTSLYINNNGNVTFGSPYSPFSSSAFPSTGYIMIAPFWGDVDTSRIVTVKYKTTSTAIYINWNSVGYYSQKTDKVNSFLLILTDGTDPVLPAGNNIGFIYGDMQWTTGSASGGTNGFGGTPATVGINKGDGMNYVQTGRFDHAGTDYDGSQGNYDGVDWLDNQSFFFDGCTFPTATIGTNATVCTNAPQPAITFTGSGSTAPYTFTYRVNGGADQTITTTTGDTVSIHVPTNATGSFTYTLVSVVGSSSPTVALASGTATITVNPCTIATAYISGTAAACKNGASPSITITGGNGTAPYTFTYTINNGPIQMITTAVGDSVATISAPTNTTGTFTYSLVSVVDASASTPSPASGTATISVVQPTATISGATQVCMNDTMPSITFTGANGIAPYTFTYTINNGANQTVTGTSNTASVQVPTNTAGTFSYALVSVKDSSPGTCTNTQSGNATVVVNALPTATISGTASICQDAAAPVITLTGAGGTAPYTFTYSINNVTQPILSTISGNSITINAPTTTAGTFVYTLLNVRSSGVAACSQTQNSAVTITVTPKPLASFTGANACAGSQVTFASTSTTPSGTLTNWNWNLGDGTLISNNANPTHTYANGGTLPVQLIVINSGGCSDTMLQNIQIYYNPVADFSNTDVCLGDTVSFTNATTINSSASILSYLWVYGDGSPTSSSVNPSHYYTTSNTYNATLVAISTDGCSGNATKQVHVYAFPTATFTVDNPCVMDYAYFNNTSTPPSDGTIASWSWAFGDGSANDVTNYNASHIYSNTGAYTGTLIVRSSNLNCADTISSTFTIYAKPVADFSTFDVCKGTPNLFTDLSTVVNDTINSWLWSFGDASPYNSSQSPAYTYQNPGTYSTHLTVTTVNGCSNTITKTTKVHAVPLAAFTTASVCDGDTAHFSNHCTITSTDTIASYDWNFGDGSAHSSSISPDHFFQNTGSYTVNLIVNSTFGCADSTSKVLNVNPLPLVHITASDSSGCSPLCITFHSDSNSVSNEIYAQWIWSFGDGSTTTQIQNPVHCYTNITPATQSYDVTLTIVSDSGCTASETKAAYISAYPLVIAGFEPSPQEATITTSTISFSDLSFGGSTWYWSFGDSTYDSVKVPPSHEYADIGTYTIMQIVTGGGICADTVYHTITIEPDFSFYIPNSFSPNGDGKNDVFIGKGEGVIEFKMLIFDRWGNLVFVSNSLDEPWDGKANYGAETAQQDLYVYSISVTNFKQKEYRYRGTVTIIR